MRRPRGGAHGRLVRRLDRSKRALRPVNALWAVPAELIGREEERASIGGFLERSEHASTALVLSGELRRAIEHIPRGRPRRVPRRSLPRRRRIPNRMATEPPPEPARRGRLPRRPRHFAPYRLARVVLVVLALIGVVALALLVLGLLNVEVVTDHFSIH